MKNITSVPNKTFSYNIQLSGKNIYLCLYILIALNYVFFANVTIQSITHPIQFFFDSSDYLRQMLMNPLTRDFYFYPIKKIQDFSNPIYPHFSRPFIYPLILALVHKMALPDYLLYSTVLVQKILYITSTLIFSAVFAKLLQPKKYALLLFALLLIFFISPVWSQWVASILTESCTISFYLLLSSCLLLQFHKSYQHWTLKLATLLVMFLFAGIRDINLYILATTSILLLAVGFASNDNRRRNLSLFYLLGTVIIISICQLSIMAEHRQVATLIDSIDSRAACQQDATLLNAYQQAGMPPQNLEAVRARETYLASEPLKIAQENPSLYHWLLSSNSSHAYAHYLLTHPYYTFIMPFNHALIEKEYRQCNRYRHHQDLASSIPQAFSPSLLLVEPYSYIPTDIIIILIEIIVAIPLLLFLLSFGISVFFKRHLLKSNPHFLVGLALMGSSLVVLLICWHAETQEVTRHSLIPVLQFYLACFYCSIALFNKYLENSQRNLAIFNETSKL